MVFITKKIIDLTLEIDHFFISFDI